MVHLHILADGRGQAVFVLAHARLFCLLAVVTAEVGGGPSHVVNVALKAGLLGQNMGFLYAGFHTAGGYRAPLMEGDGAEIAVAEAPSVVGDGELHLADGGDASVLLVHGMVGAHIGQGIHRVQLLGGQGGHGRVLHQNFVVVSLHQSLAVKRILVFVLNAECLGVDLFVGF